MYYVYIIYIYIYEGKKQACKKQASRQRHRDSNPNTVKNSKHNSLSCPTCILDIFRDALFKALLPFCLAFVVIRAETAFTFFDHPSQKVEQIWVL